RYPQRGYRFQKVVEAFHRDADLPLARPRSAALATRLRLGNVSLVGLDKLHKLLLRLLEVLYDEPRLGGVDDLARHRCVRLGIRILNVCLGNGTFLPCWRRGPLQMYTFRRRLCYLGLFTDRCSAASHCNQDDNQERQMEASHGQGPRKGSRDLLSGCDSTRWGPPPQGDPSCALACAPPENPSQSRN